MKNQEENKQKPHLLFLPFGMVIYLVMMLFFGIIRLIGLVLVDTPKFIIWFCECSWYQSLDWSEGISKSYIRYFKKEDPVLYLVNYVNRLKNKPTDKHLATTKKQKELGKI